MRFWLALIVASSACVGVATGGSGGGTMAATGGGSVDAGGGAGGGTGGGAPLDAGSDAGKPDAGPFDSGSPDAGPADAGPTDAGHSDPCANTFLCDDFESYDAGMVPAGPWGTSLNFGTAVVDTNRAMSGNQSVHFTIQAGTAADTFRRAMLSLDGTPYFPFVNDNVYGRMMLYAPSLPPNSDVHYDFVWGDGNSAAAGGDTQVKYGAMDQKHFLANYWESPTSSDCWKSSNTSLTMPEAKWTCFEWQFDGSSDSAMLWIDGVNVPEVTVMGTGDGCVNKASVPWHFPMFNHLEVGWIAYQLWGDQELWLDDVALSTQRIGCPQ